PLPDGTVMVSGGWRGRWNAGLRRGETTEEAVRGNLRTAAEVYPDLAGAELLHAAAGSPESCSADEIPIVDLVPGTGHAWVGPGRRRVALRLGGRGHAAGRPGPVRPRPMRAHPPPGRLTAAGPEPFGPKERHVPDRRGERRRRHRTPVRRHRPRTARPGRRGA